MYFERMKEARKAAGMTQQELTEEIGIDQRQYSRYEQGKTEMPVRYLIAFLKATGADPREILEKYWK